MRAEQFITAHTPLYRDEEEINADNTNRAFFLMVVKYKMWFGMSSDL